MFIYSIIFIKKTNRTIFATIMLDSFKKIPYLCGQLGITSANILTIMNLLYTFFLPTRESREVCYVYCYRTNDIILTHES